MSRTEVKQFIAADAILVTGDRNKTDQANYNQTAGPGYSLFLDGELVGCGGVRLTVGEMWCMWKKDFLAKLQTPEFSREKKIVIKTTRKHIEQIQRDSNLTRLFAEAIVSENFCEALGFKKQNNIYVR